MASGSQDAEEDNAIAFQQWLSTFAADPAEPAEPEDEAMHLHNSKEWLESLFIRLEGMDKATPPTSQQHWQPEPFQHAPSMPAGLIPSPIIQPQPTDKVQSWPSVSLAPSERWLRPQIRAQVTKHAAGKAFRTKQKAQMEALAAEVHSKLAQVKQLQHQRSLLTAKKEALEALIDVSTADVHALRNSKGLLQLPVDVLHASADSTKGSWSSGTAQTPGSLQLEHSSSDAPLGCAGWCDEAPASSGGCGTAAASASSSVLASARRCGAYTAPAPASLEVTVDPDNREIVDAWNVWFHTAAPLHLLVEHEPRDPAVVAQIEAAMTTFRDKVHAFHRSNPLARGLDLINLKTGQLVGPDDGPGDAHWRTAATGLHVTVEDETMQRFLAAHQVYQSKRAACMAARHELLQQIRVAEACVFVADDAVSNDTPYELVMARLEKNMQLEHTLLVNFRGAATKVLTMFHTSSMCLHSAPFAPDWDKLAEHLLQLRQSS